MAHRLSSLRAFAYCFYLDASEPLRRPSLAEEPERRSWIEQAFFYGLPQCFARHGIAVTL
jgi:hypothetical protein